MQSVLCDTCERPIDGLTYDFQLFGRILAHEDGTIRFPHRPSGVEVFLCVSCNAWLHLALDDLRTGFRAVRVEAPQLRA